MKKKLIPSNKAFDVSAKIHITIGYTNRPLIPPDVNYALDKQCILVANEENKSQRN